MDELGRPGYQMPPELGAGGYYLQCGADDADVFVTEDQWNDHDLHVVEHPGCKYDGGVDLDHARRHAD